MRCFVIAQVLMLNVQFAFSQNDFKTMSFSGELDGLHFNAKIDYKPDCEHQTPFVRATLHSIEVVSFDYNGETYLGNTLIGISFPIKVTEANLDIVTDIEIAGRFGVTERYELKKGFLSTTMGGRGSAFMADEFRVTDEAVKKIKEALGVSGCTDLLNKTEYQNAYLGGNSLIGWVRIEGGDLRYTKPGDGKYDDVSLKDYLIELIKKQEELKEVERENKKSEEKLEEINESRSIDDFLTERDSDNSDEDFLSESNSKSNDFLSESNEDDDFLSEDDKTKWSIETKEGKQGVISASGAVLIPFGNYTIIEYKGGIARIGNLLDSYSGEEIFSAPGSKGRYSASVFKEGFIDKTGQFLDGYRVVSTGSFKNTGGYVVLSSGNDERSAAEKQRDEEQFARKCRLNVEKEISKGREWELNTIRKYR